MREDGGVDDGGDDGDGDGDGEDSTYQPIPTCTNPYHPILTNTLILTITIILTIILTNILTLNGKNHHGKITVILA